MTPTKHPRFLSLGSVRNYTPILPSPCLSLLTLSCVRLVGVTFFLKSEENNIDLQRAFKS